MSRDLRALETMVLVVDQVMPLGDKSLEIAEITARFVSELSPSVRKHIRHPRRPRLADPAGRGPSHLDPEARRPP